MTGMMLAAFQLGFVYSLLPGPILIASSQRVVLGGWRQGCWFVIGVTLADLVYIVIVHWGISRLLTDNPLVSLGLWLVGGAWLMKLGLDALRVPLSDSHSGVAVSRASDIKHTLADGLFINLFNPLTIVGWVALGANFAALWHPKQTMPEGDGLLVLFIILSGILTWQLLVVGFVGIVRHQIHWRLLKSLSVVSGAGLMVYGLGAWVAAASLIV